MLQVRCHVLIGCVLDSKGDLILRDASLSVLDKKVPPIVIVPTDTTTPSI
jgi:hypothetical protein